MSILDTLFIKRFCLPCNSNIDSYEVGDSTISPCFCGTYNHAACLLRGKQCYEKG